MNLSATDRFLLLAVIAALAWSAARPPVTVNFVSFELKPKHAPVPVIQVPGEVMQKQL